MIDLIILVAFGIGLYAGYRKGVIKQIGSLVSLFVAILACHFFGDIVSDWTASLMGISQDDFLAREGYGIASLIGNAVLFFIVWWGLGLAVSLTHDLLKAIHLGPVNGFFGAILMAFKVLLTASLFINLWLVRDPESDIVENGGPVAEFTAAMGPKLLGVVRDNF